MSEYNPYLGQTHLMPRPSGTEPKYRYQTIRTIARDHDLWDQAFALRWDNRTSKRSILDIDTETRVRLEFLATAAGTVADWDANHGEIVSAFLYQERSQHKDDVPVTTEPECST